MNHKEKQPEKVHNVGKKQSVISDAIFTALGMSKNVYLASKIPLSNSYQLRGFTEQIMQNFETSDIIELPYEHHITRSFLGTKTKEQLQAFHDKLMEKWTLLDTSIEFNKLAWFRSFLDGRVILTLQPSDIDTEKLLGFRQSLRMPEWKPKRGVNEFTPHITLAQLSSAIQDDIIQTFITDHHNDIPFIAPALSFNSLHFMGKSADGKVSLEISQ